MKVTEGVKVTYSFGNTCLVLLYYVDTGFILLPFSRVS